MEALRKRLYRVEQRWREPQVLNARRKVRQRRGEERARGSSDREATKLEEQPGRERAVNWEYKGKAWETAARKRRKVRWRGCGKQKVVGIAVGGRALSEEKEQGQDSD